jgi:hypothetical protein
MSPKRFMCSGLGPQMVALFRDDCILRALTSRIDQAIDEFIAEWAIGGWGK